jgi:hypothetical protein
MKISNIIVIFFAVVLLFGCYKEPDFTNFDYETYNRVVGPDGGSINFYGNYANDNKNNVLVSMDIPSNALDSMMVFNMYRFEDYELVLQMENGYAEIGSKFLYFVPFYESDGYHERSKLDLSYHLSVDFKEPVTVTYNFLADGGGLAAKTWQETELHFEHYKRTNGSYRLYRMKIPKLDEWGEGNNIYVNWNNQGYPDGYDRTDLYYIITGIWSPLDSWGEGYLSLENWEPVMDFDLDAGSSSVSFEINNTDYIYVVSRIIYIQAENVPVKISNQLAKLYPTLAIERASFTNNRFTLFLSDNSYAIFLKSGDFEYLTNGNLQRSELPDDAETYINDNFPNDPVKKVTLKETSAWKNYETLLKSGVKLFFNELGQLTGTYQFGLTEDDLPADAKSYIQDQHPGTFIANVTFNNEQLSAPRYIAYISSDAKLYFDEDGNWLTTLYYRFDETELPDEITNFIADNFSNSGYSEINKTILKGEGTFFDLYFVDGKRLRFDEGGELMEMEFEFMKEDELPQAVTDSIATHFPNREVTQISLYYYDYGKDLSYDIYFSDGLNIEFESTGEIYALYGNSINHLPGPVRIKIQANYPNLELLYCSYESEGEITSVGLNEDVEHNWDLFFKGETWVGLKKNLSLAYYSKENALLTDITVPLIVNYVTANYTGQAIEEFSYYHSMSYGQMIYYLYMANGDELIFNEEGVLLDLLKRAMKAGFNKSIEMKKKKKEERIKRLNHEN